MPVWSSLRSFCVIQPRLFSLGRRSRVSPVSRLSRSSLQLRRTNTPSTTITTKIAVVFDSHPSFSSHMAPRNSSKGKGKAADQSQPPQSDHPSSIASPSTSRPIKPLPIRSPAKARITLADAQRDVPAAAPTPIRTSAPSIETPHAAASLAPSVAAASSDQSAAEQNKPRVRTRKTRKPKHRAGTEGDSNPAASSTLPHPDPQRTAAAATTASISSTSHYGNDSAGSRSAPASVTSDQRSNREYEDEEGARVIMSPDGESEPANQNLGGEEAHPSRGANLPHSPAPEPPIQAHNDLFDEENADAFNEGFYERQPGPGSSHELFSDDPGRHAEHFPETARDAINPDRDPAWGSAGFSLATNNLEEDIWNFFIASLPLCSAAVCISNGRFVTYFACSLNAFLQTRSPRNGVVQAREKLIRMLEDFLNAQRFNWGHSHNPYRMPIHIEPFGSVRFGLATEASDLDMCLCDPYRPEGFRDKFFSRSDAPNKALPQIYNPRLLATKLQSLPYIRHATPIPFANVPIVKIEAVVDGYVIQGDINTNERLGVLNSRLIKAYCELHPMFRPFCVFLKHWARSRELNDPSGSKGPISMSSYTIILLAINYLQQINHLPNLQDKELIESTSTESTRFYSTPRVRKRHGKNNIQRSTGWDTTFVEHYPGQWYDGPVTMECGLLKEWAVGFFTCYAGEDHMSFHSERQVVAVKLGRAMDRERHYRSALSVLDGGIEGLASAQDPASALVNGTMDAEGTDSNLIEGLRHINLEPINVHLASRSSSPIEYDHFEEPRAWQNHALVVQDPFYVERNTASNIRPEMVDLIKAEMIRARDMVETGFAIEQICEPLRPESSGARKARGRSKDRKGSSQTQGGQGQGRNSHANGGPGTEDGRAGGKGGRGGRGGGQSRRGAKNGAPPPSDSAGPPLQRYATSSSEGNIVYQPPR
ncbi:BZ3500_MvSof-1268-A1-R1_Chr4-1g06716 [Microbotryum saponariae]|uniref:BZ3500_MvSof-1268-A1-R1_Chr4-1g06716 protein n=1 Tax=Microbotryum saponariae TaxID=289078 RepID=A0A2X0LKU3_9BASI|nr:BZ3500_MvSof-1268-A1-R1_Chr4-1g06716 [Microbotryum saponariae]SDA06381.1 BZ3501_MvSof-1269-A2-R1_Chr4-1g06426 [Microbotryum saponariae]